MAELGWPYLAEPALSPSLKCVASLGRTAGGLDTPSHDTILSASGSASVAANEVVLEVQQAPSNKVGIFLQGSSTINVPFADGILCTGSPLKRLEAIVLDASGTGNSTASVVLAGNVSPGQTRTYQFWFRDSQGPCATGSNLSNGYEITWK